MDVNFLKNNLIAHRGLHNKIIPENSIPAFKEAIKKKYIIEFDVHILKDNNVVVFHDDNLKRLTGIDKKIKDTTYNEIKNLKLNNTENYIPLLEDVLKLVNGRVPLLIELKFDNKVGLLEDKLIDIMKDYKGLYAYQSFSPFSLIYLKKRTNMPRGLLVSDFKNSNIFILKKLLLKKMLLNFLVKPDFISVHYNYLDNKKIQKYRHDKLILTWTIKDNNLNKYKDLCDNFIFESFDK